MAHSIYRLYSPLFVTCTERKFNAPFKNKFRHIECIIITMSWVSFERLIKVKGIEVVLKLNNPLH